MADVESSFDGENRRSAARRGRSGWLTLRAGVALAAVALGLIYLVSLGLAESPPSYLAALPPAASPTPIAGPDGPGWAGRQPLRVPPAELAGLPPDVVAIPQRPEEGFGRERALPFPSGEEGDALEETSDDTVRVILQLRQDPLATYMEKSLGSSRQGRLLTDSERGALQRYADGLDAGRRQTLAAIKQEGLEVKVSLEFRHLFNGIALSTKASNLSRLSRLPEVRRVYRDAEVWATLSDSVPLIGAPQVWQMRDANGRLVTGEGVRVAVIDTGVDYTHPDLGGCLGPSCKVVGGYDFVNNDADPFDDHGHGTHVAATVAGSGVLTGVAPGARVLAYKVLNENGSGSTSNIVAALERAVDPDGDPATNDGAQVANMSLGGGGDPDDPMSQAVDAAVSQGMVVAVAAGNSGPFFETVGSPGVARKALTVAASDKTDHLARFSSRGPIVGFQNVLKPDIAAPGVSIVAAVPQEGSLGSAERYRSLNGTSMATPHVAGAAALIRQLHPGWSPDTVKDVLMNTAKDLGLSAYEQGAGRLQLVEAATSSLLVAPGSLSFGLVRAGGSASANLTLTNISTGMLTATASVSAFLWADAGLITLTTSAPVNYAQLSGYDFALQPNASVSTTVRLTLPSNAAEGYYQGKVLFRGANQTWTVPFAFANLTKPDVEVSKWLRRRAAPGGEAEYGVYFANRGEFVAHDVVLTDTLPVSGTYASYTGFYYNPNYVQLTVTPIVKGNQVIWPIGDLGVGAGGNLYPKVRFDANLAVGTAVTNTMQVGTTDPEGSYANNTSIAAHTVVTAAADLSVSKFLSHGQLAPGSSVDYAIWFRNLGDLVADDVAITDTLPASATYVSYYGYVYNPNYTSLTVIPTIAGNQVIWRIGSLMPGTGGYIYPRVRLDGNLAVGTPVTNTVRLGTSVREYDYYNNTSVYARKAVAPSVDLYVNKYLASSSGASPGATFEYGVAFGNRGALDAGDVVITDTLPVSMTYLSSRAYYYPSGTMIDVTPRVEGNQVVWALGSLEGNTRGYLYPRVHLDEEVSVGTLITNTARTRSSDPESNYFNNTSIFAHRVVTPTVDMYVYKYLSTGQATAGGFIDYGISFANWGSIVAHDVVVTDTLPASASYVSYYGYTFNPSYAQLTVTPTVVGNRVIWSLGDLGAGASGWLGPKVRLAENLAIGTPVTNTAQVGAREPDSYYANNQSIYAHRVVTPSVDLSVGKWLSSGQPAPGAAVDFGISVANNGAVGAGQVVVTDTLPVSTTYLSYSGYLYNPDFSPLTVTPTIVGNQVVWPIGSLNKGDRAYIYARVRLDGSLTIGTRITNTAQAGSLEWEPDYANNTRAAGLTVVAPSVDMYVWKYLSYGQPTPGGSFVYGISFQNMGALDARDVVITDALPVSATYISFWGYTYNPEYSPLTVTPTVAGNKVVWPIGAVGGGGWGGLHPNVKLDDRVPVGSSIINRVEVGTSDRESSYSNNTATDVRQVVASTPVATPSPAGTPRPTSTPSPTPSLTATPTRTPTATATPTPTPSADVSLYFQLAHGNVGAGRVITVELWANAGSRSINGIDTAIDFDPAYLEVVDANGNPASAGVLTPGAALPSVLGNRNNADNAAGTIDYSAGVNPGGQPASGSFLLATVRFRAKADNVSGTTIRYHSTNDPNDPRNTLVADPMGNPLTVNLQPGTIHISSARLVGSVTLQARGNAPSSRWAVPLTVTLSASGGTGVVTPSYAFTPTADASGRFTVTGFTPGTYDVRIKKARTLTNKKSSITLASGDNSVDLGRLLEGDVNGDGVINSLDYAPLSTAYFKQSGQAGFDHRVDFNEDGRVNSSDYAPFASNYFRRSDVEALSEPQITADE